MKQIEYTPASYWDRRYREGRTSGAGSEGEEGAYKAKYVSDFIRNHSVQSVIDWGCGDGQVLELIDLHDAQYLGIDVSPTIVDKMQRQFPQLDFDTDDAAQPTAELALSMDVLFHLPAEHDYDAYLFDLFNSARRFVIIYSTNYAGGRTARHVYRREFLPDVMKRFMPQWQIERITGPMREGLASFFVFEKVSLCRDFPSRSWRTRSVRTLFPIS